MSIKQRCPHCQFVNKVAGIYQDSNGLDKAPFKTTPPEIVCGRCSKRFLATATEKPSGS